MATIIKSYFEVSDQFYLCNTCKTTLCVQNSGTTSHLWNHLQRKHKTLHTQAEAE